MTRTPHFPSFLHVYSTNHTKKVSTMIKHVNARYCINERNYFNPGTTNRQLENIQQQSFKFTKNLVTQLVNIS